ncbi:hypothetical protein BC629DRAFT_911985 [Irpex lacteus]|nr:hypothetical protein BC629DRAFT_911985 [Irpex lacteus]
MLFEGIVLAVTWIRTFGTLRRTEPAYSGGVSYLMFRDGSVYFVITAPQHIELVIDIQRGVQ